MSTSTPISESHDLLRTNAVGRIESATLRTLNTLAATPAEKLDFKPSETANSIRDIAGHIVEGNGYCMQALGIPIPEMKGGTSAENLAHDIQSSGAALATYYREVSAQQLGASVQFFGSEMPVSTMAFIAEWHLSRHTGQIDYVQTIYGDLEDHD